tara:strand:+ start:4623 stop:5996 length:1374 start_codon:yes stop_codon:yes gene_type:complete
MKIGIIGAGWYGCHVALALKEAGHDVEIFEKSPAIFSQVSGNFGIRLHAGPHYPRSPETRKSCHRGFELFKSAYPELVIPHAHAYYALGNKDADQNPPKVSKDAFDKVCHESASCKDINPEKEGFNDLISAYDIDEPSILLGKKLRVLFEKKLKDANIPVYCNFNAKQPIQENNKVTISDGQSSRPFDKVVNATSYQALLPKGKTPFPIDAEVVYQPCLALQHKDKNPDEKPISFIVMDGWFPCLMPYICDSEDPENIDRKYILTHGKWTIMGSYRDSAEAKDVLDKINDDFVEEKILQPSLKEMERFWPGFTKRFEYIGWKGAVLAKLKTKREFRSAVTFEQDNIIHIIPGKVSNIFDAENEVKLLLSNKNTLTASGYTFVKGGVLDASMAEISEKPSASDRCTANLETFKELNSMPQALKVSNNSVFSRTNEQSKTGGFVFNQKNSSTNNCACTP